jgi:hypothetical protein
MGFLDPSSRLLPIFLSTDERAKNRRHSCDRVQACLCQHRCGAPQAVERDPWELEDGSTVTLAKPVSSGWRGERRRYSRSRKTSLPNCPKLPL